MDAKPAMKQKASLADRELFWRPRSRLKFLNTRLARVVRGSGAAIIEVVGKATIRPLSGIIQMRDTHDQDIPIALGEIDTDSDNSPAAATAR